MIGLRDESLSLANRGLVEPVANQEERLRLFVAVELPDAWLAALSKLQETLRSKIEPRSGVRLRWVRPEGTHLTLKFLGEVAASRLPAIEDALQAALSTPPGVRLSLEGPGLFSNRGQARVLWAGAGGDVVGVTRLAGQIDAAMGEIGFEVERRPFAPHLTLARVPENVSLAAESVASIIGTVETPAVPELAIERVSLMRSHLGRGGARYERLAAFPG